MISRRHVSLFGPVMFAAGFLSPHMVRAQSYPERPVKLVVPFAAGGLVDIIARFWVERVKEPLGTVIVENQGGAGGARGAAHVARAEPDGYTILLGNSGTQVVTPAATAQPLYAPADFAAIAIVCVSSTCVVVNPALPGTLRDLVAYAKANPGKLSYASAGTGSMTNLAGELFKHLTALAHIVHVPYRGVGPAMSDLMSGQLPMMTPNITGQLLELHRTGKVRILAVNSPERLAAAPDIPTAKEAGVAGLELQVFNGMFAPAKTPRPIIDKIAAATRIAMADIEFQRSLIKSGFDPVLDSDPGKAQRLMDMQAAHLIPLVRAIGFKVA